MYKRLQSEVIKPFSFITGQFDATSHGNDESVLSMASDQFNDILFTGDSTGYVKIWDISSYCTKQNEKRSGASSPLDSFWGKKRHTPVGTLAVPNSFGSFGTFATSKSSHSIR